MMNSQHSAFEGFNGNFNDFFRNVANMGQMGGMDMAEETVTVDPKTGARTVTRKFRGGTCVTTTKNGTSSGSSFQDDDINDMLKDELPPDQLDDVSRLVHEALRSAGTAVHSFNTHYASSSGSDAAEGERSSFFTTTANNADGIDISEMLKGKIPSEKIDRVSRLVREALHSVGANSGSSSTIKVNVQKRRMDAESQGRDTVKIEVCDDDPDASPNLREKSTQNELHPDEKRAETAATFYQPYISDLKSISDPEFLMLIHDGNVDAVKQALRYGKNPNFVVAVPSFPGMKESPLSVAVHSNQPEILEVLLETKDIDVNAEVHYPHRYGSGYSRLGADVDRFSDFWNGHRPPLPQKQRVMVSHTPLSLALVMRHFEMARLLLEAGCLTYYSPSPVPMRTRKRPYESTVHLAVRYGAPSELVWSIVEWAKADHDCPDQPETVAAIQIDAEAAGNAGICGGLFCFGASRSSKQDAKTPLELVQEYTDTSLRDGVVKALHGRLA